MTRWVSAVDRLLERALVAIFATMVLNVLWQIFSRFLLRAPSSFTEEVARFLLIWLGLLGGCYALRRGMHLGIEIVIDQLPASWRRRAALLSATSVALFGLSVLVVGGLHLVRLTLSLEQRSAALGIPLGLVYLVLPVAGALIVFYSVVSGLELLRDERSERLR